MRYLLLALTFALVGQAPATGEINVLTDLNSPFPPGCVAVSLPHGPGVGGEYLFNEKNVYVPSVDPASAAARVDIQVWRTGCHDEGYSVVMVRLKKTSGGRVLAPRVFAEAGDVDLPRHVAHLIQQPAVGNVGASANEITKQGTTYMLGVDPLSADGQTVFTPFDYNNVFTLEMFWGDYSGATDQDYLLFPIPEYDPHFDPPQSEYPILHGRMSGQYTIDGLPYNGLVLQIGEEYNPHGPDTNSVTAILFTYLNGEPFWLIGSLALQDPGFDQVTLDMLEVYGGEFISAPPGSYDEDDADIYSVGTMTIEALDCNTLLVGYNFHEGGLGAGSFEADRLIRIAGYDCNPWE